MMLIYLLLRNGLFQECLKIKASGFVPNKEMADADVAEGEAKRVLAEKMTAYQAARDDYHNKSETLKKVKAKYGIK